MESETHEPAFFASTPTTYLWAVLEQVAPGMNILNYELVAAFADQVPQCAVIVIGVNALHIGSFESWACEPALFASSFATDLLAILE